MKSVIDALVRCTRCGAKRAGSCDCWVKCSCGWLFARGEECPNPDHRARRARSPDIETRNREIFEAVLNGASVSGLAKKHRMTTAGSRQIVNRMALKANPEAIARHVGTWPAVPSTTQESGKYFPLGWLRTNRSMFLGPPVGAATTASGRTFGPFDALCSLGLSTRTLNCLASEGFSHLFEVVGLPDEKLIRIPNMGRKSIADLRRCLAAAGLSAGVPEEWRADPLVAELSVGYRKSVGRFIAGQTASIDDYRVAVAVKYAALAHMRLGVGLRKRAVTEESILKESLSRHWLPHDMLAEFSRAVGVLVFWRLHRNDSEAEALVAMFSKCGLAMSLDEMMDAEDIGWSLTQAGKP